MYNGDVFVGKRIVYWKDDKMTLCTPLSPIRDSTSKGRVLYGQNRKINFSIDLSSGTMR